MVIKLEEYRNSSIGELVKTKAFLQSTIDAIPDPIFILSLDNGKLIGYNSTIIQFLTKKNVAEKDLNQLLPQLIKDKLAEIYSYVKSNGNENLPKHLKRIITLDLKHKFQYVPFVKTIKDDIGNITSLIIIFRNITGIDIHGYIKSDILSNMVNWLLQPLNIIQMSIHALLDKLIGEINSKQEEFLAAARGECLQIRKIIRDLNELDKIESTSVYMGKRENISLITLIKNILKNFNIYLIGKKMKIQAEIPPILSNVTVDEIQISTVIKILLENAVDNGLPNHDITLKVEQRDDKIIVKVHNFGKEIPQKFHEEIFEKFFKLPEDNSDREGIGLYIAKKIINSHDGQIWVESDKDTGTTFILTLPFERE